VTGQFPRIGLSFVPMSMIALRSKTLNLVFPPLDDACSCKVALATSPFPSCGFLPHPLGEVWLQQQWP
jgi:hypothetical protein